MKPIRKALLGAMTALFATTATVQANDTAPLRIGVITFLSGPAAGPVGVPATNAADVLVDAFNKARHGAGSALAHPGASTRRAARPRW